MPFPWRTCIRIAWLIAQALIGLGEQIDPFFDKQTHVSSRERARRSDLYR